jgi:hypothetical protein
MYADERKPLAFHLTALKTLSAGTKKQPPKGEMMQPVKST